MTYWITDDLAFLQGEPIWRIWIDDDDTHIESNT